MDADGSGRFRLMAASNYLARFVQHLLYDQHPPTVGPICRATVSFVGNLIITCTVVDNSLSPFQLLRTELVLD